MHPNRMSPVQWILTYGLLIAACAALALTLLVFSEGRSATLFADSWTVLMDYQGAGFRFSFPSLVLFHNEHRPLFARVFILADILWAGGRGWLPFGVIFLTQAVQAWLLCRIAARQPWFQKHDRIPVFSLAIFCCFTIAQTDNFLWSFQTAFVMNFVFITGAAAAVAAQKESASDKWSALVFVSIGAAPLCLASGMFVWMLAAALALAIRLPRKWPLAYAAVGILGTPVYFLTYRENTKGLNNPMGALGKPMEVLSYVGHLLGSAWKGWPLELGELLTVAAIVMLAIRVYRLVRRPPGSPWEAVPLGVMMVSLGTALLTALARVQYGVKQAESTRYQTPALLFWFAAALVVLSLLPKDALRWRLLFNAFILIAMISSFRDAPETLERARTIRAKMDIAGAAWVSGVDDEESLNPMVAGNQLRLYWPMRERRLGPFSIPPGSEMGSILPVERIQVGSFCDGKFSRNGFFSNDRWPGVRLRGSARRASDGSPLQRFLVTTIDRRIVGAGSDGVAFAGVKTAEERLIVYGLPGDGKACAIVTD